MWVIGRSSAISFVTVAVLEGQVAARRRPGGGDRALARAMVQQREGVDDEGVLRAQAVRGTLGERGVELVPIRNLG